MSMKQTYGNVVNKLPISGNKKGWLRRNWIGGLVGFLSPLLFFISMEILPFDSKIIDIIMSIIFWPVHFIPSKYSLTVAYGLIIFIPIMAIINALLGAFIQSLLRRIFRGRW